MNVYFVQSGVRGPVKIGTAANVAKRLRALQTGNPVPLKLLVVTPGGYSLEAELHNRFARGRLADEWFAADTPGLFELIEHVAREGALPVVEHVEDGEACPLCGWAMELELAERGADRCWRCMSSFPPLVGKKGDLQGKGGVSGGGGNRTRETFPPLCVDSATRVCLVCGESYINRGAHAESCRGPRTPSAVPLEAVSPRIGTAS